MSSKNPLILLLIFIILVACNNQQQNEEAESRAAESDNGELFLTVGQLEYAGIEYGSIQNIRLSSDVNARGELILPVNSIADLVSQYPGVLKSIHVREGDKVSKGQTVATLSSPEFIEAQQRYLMVKNQLIMLQQEYDRQKELNKNKIASDKNFQKAMADYNMALAEYNGLSVQLGMAGVDIASLDAGEIISKLPIVSTLDGHIESIDANPGKYIMHEERLIQVINTDKLFIELNVFEKDIMKIFTGQRVTFTLANLSNKVYEASVIAVGNTVRQENRVVKVLAEFKNEHGRMLPGMFVASEIHTGEEEVEALPEEAVIRIGNDQYIIFYTTPERTGTDGTSFVSVAVTTGFSEDGFIEINIAEEIPADAMIVVKGGYFLKTEIAKQAE